MSIISTRPRVRSVVNAKVLDNVLSVAEVMNSTKLRQSSHNVLIQGQRRSRRISSVGSVTNLLESVAQMQLKRFQQLKAKVSEIEALKSSTLELITRQPFAVSNPAALMNSIKTLEMAKTAHQAVNARQFLMREVTAQHNRVVTNTLRVVCTNAFKKIGFTPQQLISGSDDQTRLIAVNSAGTVLVTEITVGEQTEPSISTEVVSGCDKKTPELLDALDKALEEEGVRAAKPIRKETGGVCELDTAREVLSFVRRKIAPQQDSMAGQHSSDAARRRSQRLNDKRTRNQSKH